MTFKQKSNRDRHVKNIHSNEVLEHVLSISDQTANAVETVATFDDETANAMNVSFLADEQGMSRIEKETPIFEVFEPVLYSSIIDEDNIFLKDSDHILTMEKTSIILPFRPMLTNKSRIHIHELLILVVMNRSILSKI